MRKRRQRVKQTLTQPAPVRKPIVGNASKLIAALPEMTLIQTVRAWRNSISKLNDVQTARLRKDAKKMLAAIEHEWTRRAASPEGFFEWPSTDAPVGMGSLSSRTWPPEGILGYLGYHVGSTQGLPVTERQAILSRVFSGQLPPAFPVDYMNEWGRPSTARRLQKMADSIAAFARNAKRHQDGRQDQAAGDWEVDLKYLYDEYYVGHFRFAWPLTGESLL